VAVEYRPPANIAAQPGLAAVQLGPFADARDVDAHWLGAIRGGFGQPLKSLVTNDPVVEVVRKGFSQGLAARGLLGQPGGAPYILSATIQKFDCSQYVRREAHARIALTLTESASGKVVVSESFQRDLAIDNPNLFDAGILATTDDLQAVAAQALREIVDTS